MARAATKKKDAEFLQATGTIQYFGYGTGKYGSAEKSQVSFIPTDAKWLREKLSELYIAADIDEKWLPDFVAKDKDRINLSSTFDIPVLVYDGDGRKIETTVKDFCSEYGTPKKGTIIDVRMKFKNGSLYPVAVRFASALEDIETYSLESLFD